MRERPVAVARRAHRLTEGSARHVHAALASRGLSDGRLSDLAHLAGVLWLPVVLFAVVVSVAWLVGRVWGRRRLSRSGCWFEVRLGEEVSRAGLEAFMRTLAHGLPRPLVGGVPWVGLSVSAVEDRAGCWLFVSGGLSSAQVRAALEQALGGVTVEAPDGPVLAGGGVCRVACLRAVESRFLPLRVDQRVDPAGQLLAALRAQASGEGGVVQLVLQAPPRSARVGARRQASRLRAGQGLGPGGPARLVGAVGEFAGGVLDVLTPGSPHPMGRRVSHGADPFSLERARAIEAKASGPLLAGTVRVGAWASSRRRARGRLAGVLAAFGQYRELGGLQRGREPVCRQRLAGCLSSVRPGLLLGCGEAAALVPVPQESGVAPVSFAEAPGAEGRPGRAGTDTRPAARA